MTRPKVLFQGSHKQRGTRQDPPETLPIAMAISCALGKSLIQGGLDSVVSGFKGLDAEFGRSAVATCHTLGIEPRERIRTYAYGAPSGNTEGFGMVLEAMEDRWQEVRTFLIQECDAIVAIIGGKGTADVLQKAMLAHKPVFPIPVAGGAAATEWERLKRAKYCNRRAGDLDFLADRSLSPEALADTVAHECAGLLKSQPTNYSRRIFVVHGRDGALKSEVARFLERLNLEPVILHEQPDKGATIFDKLLTELSDVGYAFVLISPDDRGSLAEEKKTQPRARQNVVFEHGLLVGRLGSKRVCAVVKGAVEVPSDLQGVVYKHIPHGGSIDAIAIELVRELVGAGYEIDPQALWK
jgi:predicted nucleotide-binding protein